MNEEYIRKLSPEEYVDYLKTTAEASAWYLQAVLPFVQERHKIGQGFSQWTDLFFKVDLEYHASDFLAKDFDKTQAETMLSKSASALDKAEAFTNEAIDALLKKTIEDLALPHRSAQMAVRVAITGSQTSLPLYDVMRVLGRDRSIIRLKQALSFLKTCR